MGNNNVSGLQEQEKNDAEEPNKSQDVQEEYTALNSKEQSGESDTEKHESDVREPNETKIEESTGLATVPLLPTDTDSGLEINSSAARSNNPVQSETSIQEETEEWMESPADMETSSQEAESTESECSPVKPAMEDGNNLELGSSEPAESCVTAMKEQIQHGVSSTNSEVDMEPQRGNEEVNIIQNSKGAEIEEIVTILNDVGEGNGEHQPMGLNPFGKDSNEMQTKAASMIESRELSQVKASEFGLKMKAKDTEVIENGIKIEGNETIGKALQSSESSAKESKVEKMDEYESARTSTGHKEAEGSEDEELLSYGIKGEARIDVSNVTENGHHVESVIKENSIELENENEIFFEIYTPPAAVIDANVKLQREKVLAEITDKADEDEKVEMTCLPYHIDPEFLSMETPKQLEDVCISTVPSQVNELTNNLTDSKTGDTEFEKSKDHDSSATESYQEARTTSIDVTPESSFRAENPIANTEVPSVASAKQDFKHHPVLHQIESTEANQTFESYISEPTSDDVKINTEATEVSICELLRSDLKHGESDRTPLLNQEVTQKTNTTSLRHTSIEKQFEEAEEIQEKSVEKQVIALERTSTETLKAPLLNYMREENHHAIESPKKQEKNKTKFSLFSNCMCCTPVSQ